MTYGREGNIHNLVKNNILLNYFKKYYLKLYLTLLSINLLLLI